MDVSAEEKVTFEERQENEEFLNAILKTNVMKETHQYLVSKNVAPADKRMFKDMLHDIWFRLFKRAGGR